MSPTRTFTALLAVPLLLVAGCAADADPETTTAESAQTAESTLSAKDGPLFARITVSKDNDGKVRRTLSVVYDQPLSMYGFLPCQFEPSRQNASLVFIVGPEGARASVTRPLTLSCPYGDSGWQQPSGHFRVVEGEDQQLWDTLFPPRPDGTRWYALQVALTNGYGSWDSRYGANYRLVLQP